MTPGTTVWDWLRRKPDTSVLEWLHRNGESVFMSVDFLLGLGAGFVTFFVADQQASLRENSLTVLLSMSGIGVAVVGFVLTAVGLLVTFMDPDYRTLLETVTSDGIQGATRPYKIASAIGGAASVSGLVGVALSQVAVDGLESTVLAVTAGLTVWAVAGTVQLVSLTLWHAGIRMRLHDAISRHDVPNDPKLPAEPDPVPNSQGS